MPRSASASSSVRRPPSTTSAGSVRSSACEAAPRPRHTPRARSEANRGFSPTAVGGEERFFGATATTRRISMSDDNKALVRRYEDEVLNGRNLDAVGDYFADERVIEGVRRGCFSYFQAFPDLHVSIDELIAEGDKVFCRSTFTGTHDGEYKGIPATGRHVAAESAEVFTIGDGKFVGYWCLTNVAGLMRQLTEEQVVAPATAGR